MTWAPSSDTRNAVTAAISSPRPKRPAGVRYRIFRRAAGSLEITDSSISVEMDPGPPAFARIPSTASDRTITSANATAALIDDI